MISSVSVSSNRSRTGIESRLFYRLIYLSWRYARREVLPKIGASYFLTSLLSAHLSTDKRESLSLSCLERRGDSIRNVSYSTSFRWLYYRTTRFPKDFQKGILLLFSARAERDSHKRSFEFTRFLLLHYTELHGSKYRDLEGRVVWQMFVLVGFSASEISLGRKTCVLIYD